MMSKVGRKKRGSPATSSRLLGKRHISQGPGSVQARTCTGHFEGDTVMGADARHCVLTLVDRKTRYLVIKKLSPDQGASGAALALAIAELGGQVKTITLDNGTEFHDYASVERISGVKFYFATPYHSWERGTNENTNGLIRQYGHVSVKTVTKQVGDRQMRFKTRKLLAHRRNDDSLVLAGGSRGEWTPHDLRRTAATMMQSLRSVQTSSTDAKTMRCLAARCEDTICTMTTPMRSARLGVYWANDWMSSYPAGTWCRYSAQ